MKSIKTFALLSVLALLVGCSSSNKSLEGDGSKANPFKIYNEASFKEAFKEDNLGENYYYQIEKDITFKDEFVTIGSETNPFVGHIDGKNHTLKGIKFHNASTLKKYYSLFAETDLSFFSNLNVEMDIKLDLMGKGKTYVIGGLSSLAINTYFDNIHVKYSNFNVNLGTNGGSNVVMGGLVPYMGTEQIDGSAFYIDVQSSSVKGNIVVDSSEASDTDVVTGGVVGQVANSYAEGIFSLNNNRFEGNIDGGEYVGAIAGYTSYYTSITNSYVKANHISTSNSGLSYVGGLTGFGYYETAFMHNYVDIDTIGGSTSNESYLSYAGDLVGYAAKSELEYGYEGCSLYNSYAKGAEILLADNKIPALNKANYSAELLKDTLGFNEDIWDVSTTNASIKKNPVSEKSVTLSVDYNGGEGNIAPLSLIAGLFSSDVAMFASTYRENVSTRNGYSLHGLYYDNECQYSFRWYAPINKSVTIYLGWTDISFLLGTWTATIGVGSYSYSHTWVFTEDTFYWIHQDGSVSPYTYYTDGDFVYICDYVGNPQLANSMGGYFDEVMRVSDNGTKLSLYDVNDSDYEYVASKNSSEVPTVPSLKDSPLLGSWWYLDTGYNIVGATFDEFCDVTAKYVDGTNDVKYYGGILISGNSYTIAAYGRLPSDTYVYDGANELLIGQRFIMSKEMVVAQYSSSEYEVRVLVTENRTLAVINGVVSNENVVVSSDSVTIGETTYNLDGKTIVLGSTTPETPETPEEPKSIVGTYSGTIGRNTATLTVNADGTGVLTWGDAVVDFTWTLDGSSFKVNIPDGVFDGDTYTWTFDEMKGTLVGELSQDYEFTWEVSFEVLPEEEPSVNTCIVGTYSGTIGAGNATLLLNDDGTGVLTWGGNPISITWTLDGTTLTVIIPESAIDGDTYNWTYNETLGTITGIVTQDCGGYEYNVSFTRS